jgi:hypothetical protein
MGNRIGTVVLAAFGVLLGAAQAQGQVGLLRNGGFETKKTLSPWVIEAAGGGGLLPRLMEEAKEASIMRPCSGAETTGRAPLSRVLSFQQRLPKFRSPSRSVF